MAQKRTAARWLQARFGASQRRSCVCVGLARTSCRYQCRREPEAELLRALRALAERHPGYGYRRLGQLLRRERGAINPKRTLRLYRQAGLQRWRKGVKKRTRMATPTPLPRGERPHQVWAMDFIHDQLELGRRLRIFDAVDTCAREAVQLNVSLRQNARSVCQALDQACSQYGQPEVIVCDNGSEFRSQRLRLWSQRRGIRLHFIALGRPMQNGYIESFHARLRDECLNTHAFRTLAQARQILAEWTRHYNLERPHGALHGKTPTQYRLALTTGAPPAADGAPNPTQPR